jgi:hypothetical protein
MGSYAARQTVLSLIFLKRLTSCLCTLGVEVDLAVWLSRSVRQILLEGDFNENLSISYDAVRRLPFFYSEIGPGYDFKDNGSNI